MTAIIAYPEEKAKDEGDKSRDKFLELMTESVNIQGHIGEYTDLKSIPWVDYSLIRDGLRFYEKYFSAFIMSSAMSIFLGVTVKPISAVFFRVGSLHDPDLAFKRIVRTFAGVHKFYEVISDSEKSRKHFDLVRKMHLVGSTKKMKLHGDNRPIPEILKDESQEPWKKELIEALKNDLNAGKAPTALTHDELEALDKYLVWDPSCPINQCDMVMTALSSFGSMWYSPAVFGIKDREQEMKGIIHLWAVISKLLGIEDRFNIFIDWNVKVADMLQNIMFRSFQLVDETAITLQCAVVREHYGRVGITYKGILYEALRMNQINPRAEHLWAVMGWKDKFCATIMRIVYWLIANVPGFMRLTNAFLRMNIERVVDMHSSKVGLKRG